MEMEMKAEAAVAVMTRTTETAETVREVAETFCKLGDTTDNGNGQ
jgi:hypothetical protein